MALKRRLPSSSLPHRDGCWSATMLNGFLMGPRRMTQDLARTLRGAAAFLQYLSSRQDLDVAIGLLSAESSVAKKGERNDYRLRIANAICAPRSLVVTISLCVANAPERSQGRYAYFTTSLTVQPSACTTVTLQYDWTGEAHFCVDGALFPPEDSRRGAAGTPDLYAITATLWDTEGGRLDELTVYQTLTE